jgi:hypothetical protein
MSIFAGKPPVSDDCNGLSTRAGRDNHSVGRADLIFIQ